jgi:mannosyltransferase OCH1-like enzyme
MELYHEQQPHKNEAIPKLLHFVHVSGTLQRHTATYPSKEVLRNVEDWKAVHPTWTIRVWTNPQVIDNFPHLLPLLQALAAKQAPMSWLSDILRYAIIHRYGGVYLDTDVRPLRPLDPLLVLQNFTVCEEPRVRPRHYDPSHVQDLILGWRRCKLVGTAVVASTPQSPALWDALVSACSKSKTALEEAYNVSRILFRTDYSGPPLWTASARQQINPLFTETFFPCTWKKVSICVMSNFVNQSTSFAMHEWKKSWDGSTDAI